MNQLAKYRGRTRGFTVVELIISMGATAAVIGALLIGSFSMQKSLNGSEKYASAYSDQRRLTDFIGRDLRRAVGVAATNEAGEKVAFSGSTVTINDRATLVLTLPGYYRSNVKAADDFDESLDVVGTDKRLDYGTKAGLAPTVEVTFRKVFVGSEKRVCFVRQEAGVDEIIVRDATNLFAQVTVQSGTQSGSIRAWFRAPYSGAAPLVSTYDRLLLRNPPLDQQL